MALHYYTHDYTTGPVKQRTRIEHSRAGDGWPSMDVSASGVRLRKARRTGCMHLRQNSARRRPGGTQLAGRAVLVQPVQAPPAHARRRRALRA